METATFEFFKNQPRVIVPDAWVTPKSKKAKNRFANLMDFNDGVEVEQHKGNKVFVTSANGKNHFWVNLNQDKDWDIEF